MSKKIITFLSDFGCDTGYVSQMKGVACAITDASLVDISHEIIPHDVRMGAFVLWSAVPYFPRGTVHVAVVDPGVGTNRKGLVITTRSHILVGPDNGLLIPAARFLGDFVVYEITNPKFWLQRVSHTFHGRDIFTPVASYICNGTSFDEIGKETTDFVDLSFGQAKVSDQSALGNVIFIDRFGTIITNIPGSSIQKALPFDSKVLVRVGKKQMELPFVKSYGYVKKGEMLITVGSSNMVEIGMNQGDAAKKLGIKLDDVVKVLFV